MSDVKSQQTSIFETTAVFLEQSGPKKGSGISIVKNISELLRSLGSGDQGRIEKAFDTLGAARENEIYQKLGQMTRNLHDALQEFSCSLTRDPHHMQSTNIGDASVKLENVVKMTSEATHQTLGFTEAQQKSLTICKVLNERIEKAIASSSPVKELNDLLSEQKKAIECSENLNAEILMTQSFQDLTGQAVKKVITLVSGLEENLVSMVKIFGIKQKVEEPQTEVSKPRLGQDAADSILSEFGF